MANKRMAKKAAKKAVRKEKRKGKSEKKSKKYQKQGHKGSLLDEEEEPDFDNHVENVSETDKLPEHYDRESKETNCLNKTNNTNNTNNTECIKNDSEGYTPLCFAALNGVAPECIAYFMWKANRNEIFNKCNRGKTPLQFACIAMNPITINVLTSNSYNYDRLDLVEKIQYLPSLIKDMKFYEPNIKSGPYELSLMKNYERLSKINRTSNLKDLYKK